ncbi:MAG: hypothetical protein KC505_11465, partial [Myxococcales bacterium]|nr:hypothetical protein [Myxococcales bacterium]
MNTEKTDDSQLSLEPLPDLEPLLEALIFASRNPMSIEKMVEVLQAADINAQAKDVRHALKFLRERWESTERTLGR